MSHDRDYYRHHRMYLAKITGQAPEVNPNLAGEVAGYLRQLDTRSNIEIGNRVVKVAATREMSAEDRSVLMEAAERLLVAEAIVERAEPGVN